MALALDLLDVLADGAGFFLRIPDAADGRLLAVVAVGEQRFAEPVLVVGDQAGGGGQDMAGRTVVAFEADNFRAGKVFFETQDVVDVGAAPAVDRLIVIADAADIVAALRDQAQPEVLDGVGVLVLVDENVLEPFLPVAEHIRIFAEQAQRLEQQVAEIGRVQRLQPVLIERVEFRALAVGEGLGFARRNLVGRQAPVLPGVDLPGERARRPALVVDVLGLDHLLQEADLVVGVENREIGFQADEFGMATQDLGGNGVERAEPGHAFGHRARQRGHAFPHLARRLVGEGDSQDFRRARLAERQNVGDAGRQHAGLAGAGAGQHQNRAVDRFHRRALLGIERRQPGRRAGGGKRALADAAGGGRVKGRFVSRPIVIRLRRLRQFWLFLGRFGMPPMWGARPGLSRAAGHGLCNCGARPILCAATGRLAQVSGGSGFSVSASGDAPRRECQRRWRPARKPANSPVRFRRAACCNGRRAPPCSTSSGATGRMRWRRSSTTI